MIVFCLLLVFPIIFASNDKILKVRSAAGPCILNKCPEGFLCKDAFCVPDMSKMEKIGECVNGLCPDTFFCHNDSCLRLIPVIVVGSKPIGPCVNEKCPAKHVCQKSDYQCYPHA